MIDTPNANFWIKLEKLETTIAVDSEIRSIFDKARTNYHAMETRVAWELSLLLAKRTLLTSNSESKHEPK